MWQSLPLLTHPLTIGYLYITTKFMSDVTTNPGSARRLMESIRALVRRFGLAERADVSCCGMTVSQAATLEALSHTDGLRPGELGRRLGITPSTMTRNLSRLVDRGLVATNRDPADGRSSTVTLTPAGRQAAGAVRQQEEAFFELVLAKLPDDCTDDIVDALELLWAAVRNATERCCPGAFDHLMFESLECERSPTHDYTQI
jgi:DNA-binding MarR family transcriptional regulator